VVDRRATGTVRGATVVVIGGLALGPLVELAGRTGAGATTNPPLSSSFLSTDVIEDGDVACS